MSIHKAIAVIAIITAVCFSTAVPANSAPARVSVKTDWGIVSIPIVKEPKRGKCVGVSARVNVRNSANVPTGGINMGIVDDFGNLIAYSEWTSFIEANGKKDLSKSKSNGIYIQPMVACGKPGIWTDPYRPNVTVPLVSVKSRESYTFTIIASFNRDFQGDADYVFKK